MRKTIKKVASFFFHEIFFRSSWVIFYALLALSLYEKEMKSFNSTYDSLAKEYENYQNDLILAKDSNEELKREIGSFFDPNWLELILMKNLGVVPEGYEKIIIIEKSNGK